MRPAGRLSLRDLGAPPNLVTLTRLALVPVVLVLLAGGRRAAAVLVLLVMVATDGLDGLLARRTGRITELGKILDPLVDKIALGAVLAFLTLRGEFPAWALAVILARDVAIIAGAIAMVRKQSVIPAAVGVGKVALVVLTAMAIVFAADIELLETPFLILGLALVVLSTVCYGCVRRSAIRERRDRADCRDAAGSGER